MGKASFEKSGFPRSRGAFTLAEMIVTVTILSIILVSVFEIYYGILSLSKRLDFSRILQENARSVTEMFAGEIRERSLDAAYYDASTPEKTLDFSNGNDVLAIRSDPASSPVRYYLMQDSPSGPVRCASAEASECYLGRETVGSDGTSVRLRITDSRVRIERLKFFISGVPADTVASWRVSWPLLEAKVTVLFDLRIPHSKGLDPKMLEGAKIRAQTTITEKLYKAR